MPSKTVYQGQKRLIFWILDLKDRLNKLEIGSGLNSKSVLYLLYLYGTEKLSCIVKLTFSNDGGKDHAHIRTNNPELGKIGIEKSKIIYNIPYLLTFDDSYV